MPFAVYQFLDSDDAHTFYEQLDSFESLSDLKAAIPGLLDQLIEGLKAIGYTEEGPDLPGGLPKSKTLTISVQPARLSSGGDNEVVYAFDNECGLFVVHATDDAESELEDYDPADDDYKELKAALKRNTTAWDAFVASVKAKSAKKLKKPSKRASARKPKTKGKVPPGSKRAAPLRKAGKNR